MVIGLVIKNLLEKTTNFEPEYLRQYKYIGKQRDGRPRNPHFDNWHCQLSVFVSSLQIGFETLPLCVLKDLS
jgi:hypothetical protein